MNSIELARVVVDNVTLNGSLFKLDELVKTGEPRLIVTPNPEMIVKAQDDGQLLNILNNAHLRLPDGISMVVVSRIKGAPLAERVTGIDFLTAACARAAQKGWTVFFFGGGPNIALKAGEVLQKKNPDLKIAGTASGYYKPSEERDIITRIKDSKPDILFAGLGGGHQEKWLANHMKELNIPVVMGVGGSFDVISGYKARAPKWIQALYIEWLYRLFSEPTRWRRQLALPKFLWLTLIKYR